MNNGYTYYPTNPMPQPPNPQPQNPVPMDCNCDFIVVPGPQAVKDFVVRPNQKRYFLDANNPIMYVKSADSFGMSDTKAYRTEPISFDDLLRQDAASTFPGVQRDEYNDLEGHLTCSVNGTCYDIWDCTDRETDKYWLIS